MQVVDDLYVEQMTEDEFVIYSPLRGKSLLVNKSAAQAVRYLKSTPDLRIQDISSPKLVDFIASLKRQGLLDDEVILEPPPPSKTYQPTGVTLFPTFNCNLRCVYCYANSGDIDKTYMDWDIAKASIDFIVKNALQTEASRITVEFLGGGEPTLGWTLLKRAVEYARARTVENDLGLITQIVTNGVLGKKQREWIVANISHVQVSIDGPPNVQNAQRPMIQGRPSSDYVVETIKYFEEQSYNYGIHAVITRETSTQLIQLVDYFSELCPSISRMTFEPLFTCGRCAYSGVEAPDAAEFSREYVVAWKHAAQRGIKLTCSMARLSRLNATFCGASGSNMTVTPYGDLTSCVEVSTRYDKRAPFFMYGHYDQETASFVIDHDRLNKQADRNLYNLPTCHDCAVKWHCGGDCLARAMAENKLFDPASTERCFMTRKMTIRQVYEILKNDDLAEKTDTTILAIPC